MTYQEIKNSTAILKVGDVLINTDVHGNVEKAKVILTDSEDARLEYEDGGKIWVDKRVCKLGNSWTM